MTETKIRDILVDPDTKARLQNQAFMTRSSVSELVRQILQGVAEGEYADAEEKNERAKGRARIGVVVDDDLWDAVEVVAFQRGESRSALVRLVADYLYGNVPVDRKQVTR